MIQVADGENLPKKAGDAVAKLEKLAPDLALKAVRDLEFILAAQEKITKTD